MKSVWLFKSESDSNDSYIQVLKDNGFIAENIPTLQFEFINDTALDDALKKPDKFNGMIFTSPRAVQAVGSIYGRLPVSLHKEWSTHKVFVVGKTTEKEVKQTLCLNSIGSESGNAKQLGPIIVENTKSFDKPLFLPCGNLKRDELPTFLAKNDRDFRAITCYETKQHSQLQPTLTKLAAQRPTFIVFFSPSGVQHVLPLIVKIGINLTGIHVIAIGPATNVALVSKDIPVAGICPEPSPEGLVQVLKTF